MHVVAAFAFLGTREYRLVGSGTTNWKLSTMSSLVTGPRSRLFRGVLLHICTVVDTAMCALATLERILCFKWDDFCVFTRLSICGHKWNAANTIVSTRILPAKWAKLSKHYRLGVPIVLVWHTANSWSSINVDPAHSKYTRYTITTSYADAFLLP